MTEDTDDKVLYFFCLDCEAEFVSYDNGHGYYIGLMGQRILTRECPDCGNVDVLEVDESESGIDFLAEYPEWLSDNYRTCYCEDWPCCGH